MEKNQWVERHTFQVDNKAQRCYLCGKEFVLLCIFTVRIHIMALKDQIVSTISRKGQTTIPAVIRRLLHVYPGDMIKYDIHEDGVQIKKITGIDLKWAKAIESTLTEWSDPEDDDL